MKKNTKIILWISILFISIGLNAQNTEPNIQSKLNGTIVDQISNQPIIGASVNIKGTTHGVETDIDGKFYFQTGQKFPYTLVINYIGYNSKEVVVDGSPVVIKLTEQVEKLDEIVVVGYGTSAKKTFTGATSKIDAKQIANRPAQSFDQLLGGQASGLNIVQPSGSLNNTPVIRIRGINSITSSLYPLIIVDGVTVFTGTAGGAIGNNPLSDINPNDIESIDVLKDASAAAVYGSRAANGVIVITTKKGKKGKVNVNYDVWVSWNKATNLPKLLNAEDYVSIKNEARTNAGLTPGFALGQNADGSTIGTNWYDVAYHTGVSQNHNLSFSGATNSTSYFISTNYSNQNGILRTNEFVRKGIRLNFEHKLNNALTLGTNFSYNNSLNSGPNSGSSTPNSIGSSGGNAVNTQYIGLQPLGRLTYILPSNVSVYNPDGSYNINPSNGNIGYGANSPSLGVFNAYNLQTILDLDKNTSENNTFIGSIYAELEIIKNLKFKTVYGINNFVVENKEFRNPYSGDGFSTKGAATNSNTKYSRSNWTNTLTYATVFDQKHSLKVLLGQEKNTREIDGWGAIKTGLTDPFFTSYQGGFTTIAPGPSVQTENVLLSYFSSIAYDYDKRYLLNLNFRRDGLSALASGNKWGNFGGASVGWNISEEDFFKSSSIKNVLNAFKVRASYGVVGNSELNDYAALSQYSAGTYAGVPTLNFSQSGNSNLKWETSKKLDFGINFGLFDNRITVEADYYKNNINDLILNAPQSLSQGIPNNSIAANVGSLYNKGFELSVNANIINGNDFQWNANFNLSTIKNKVTSLGGYGDIYPTVLSTFGIQNITREGYSVGSIFAVPTTGVNPENGNRVYVNANNEEVQYNALTKAFTYLNGATAPAIDNYRDGRIQGPSLPTYYGGLNNNLSYKNFDLTIGLTFSGGNKLYNGTRSTLSDQRFFNNGTFIKDRWTTPGQVTDVPKLIYGDSFSGGFSSSNSAYVEDGSYLKVKNIILSYRIPVKNELVNKYISSAKVYAQGSNLHTWTKYRGSDPEISINGNSINSGKDQNVPANSVVFTLGLNVGF
ncbi:SusC/RagA family TonB-linked outer membrane protein [Flavobacterium bizetiae]|uniref:SusC/RagA family TonB-linked outer membrane protein n=1 Tax=Flavobacterium bizetiae TaxID=2704140 RepID=UPI0021E8857E|nr:SusC/RagA family TonB-linked outer membrane protein [Flavobacterium bizetiae]UTN03795.1 SusC/RagA family TonB-linked outer membrane protein [Flavobacterium bizetiae]